MTEQEQKFWDHLSRPELSPYLGDVSELGKFVVKDLEKFMFDPNDSLTRKKVLNRLSLIMDGLVANRYYQQYTVVCDESNNTASDIDSGRLTVDLTVRSNSFSYHNLKFTIGQ